MNINKTFTPIFDYDRKKWFLIDCKNQKLGRLSTIVCLILCGKMKSSYYPSIDMGDYVILINAESLTLDREIGKFHIFCPGRPGHSLKRSRCFSPETIVEKCIGGMLPNGPVSKRLLERVKIYEGPNHPHEAQNPIKLDLDLLQFDIDNFSNEV